MQRLGSSHKVPPSATPSNSSQRLLEGGVLSEVLEEVHLRGFLKFYPFLLRMGLIRQQVPSLRIQLDKLLEPNVSEDFIPSGFFQNAKVPEDVF